VSQHAQPSSRGLALVKLMNRLMVGGGEGTGATNRKCCSLRSATQRRAEQKDRANVIARAATVRWRVMCAPPHGTFHVKVNKYIEISGTQEAVLSYFI
jgi:hypothetical protein